MQRIPHRARSARPAARPSDLAVRRDTAARDAAHYCIDACKKIFRRGRCGNSRRRTKIRPGRKIFPIHLPLDEGTVDLFAAFLPHGIAVFFVKRLPGMDASNSAYAKFCAIFPSAKESNALPYPQCCAAGNTNRRRMCGPSTVTVPTIFSSSRRTYNIPSFMSDKILCKL